MNKSEICSRFFLVVWNCLFYTYLFCVMDTDMTLLLSFYTNLDSINYLKIQLDYNHINLINYPGNQPTSPNLFTNKFSLQILEEYKKNPIGID